MKKVLVVDDDVELLTVVGIILSAHYIVEMISDWQKVNAMVHDFKPDLIVLDIYLGSADGREICKEIKTITEIQHIPVLLYSANNEQINHEDCNAQAFIPKPFEIKDLLSIIDTLLHPLDTAQENLLSA